MIVRKLKAEENIRTRALYEEVFSEDDAQFVDYYYHWKIRDNVIYVAENEDGIQSMVHLNPFLVYRNGEVQKLHYIVAVATRKEYRHQGLMRRLLAMAEQDMQQAGEALTFLMPASEAIYLPFGYRFFAWQRRGILCAGANRCGKDAENEKSTVEKGTEKSLKAASVEFHIDKNSGSVSVECLNTEEQQIKRRNLLCRPVSGSEYQALADFVNAELKKQYDLFIWRDAAYYERLCAEQQCQGGEVRIICRDEQLQDMICAEADQSEAKNTVADESEKVYAEAGRVEILGTFCTAWEEPEIQTADCESAAGNGAASDRTGGVHALSPLLLREIILDTSHFEEAQDGLLHYIKAYGACKVEGCQRELVLQEESNQPLLMGKVPGEGVFTRLPEAGTVFMNEVV